MHGRALTFTVACLLVVSAVLLYLEWWRAGELELLNGRVDELEDFRRRRETKPAAAARKPKPATTEGPTA